MSLYAGNPLLWPVQYDIPDDGDLEDAASANIGFEALGDRTAYLHAATTGLTSGDSFQLPLFGGMSDFIVGVGPGFGEPVWQRIPTTNPQSIQQASFGATWEFNIHWDIPIPPKSRITSIIARLEGATGHAALGMPSAMPGMVLYETNIHGVSTMLGSANDTSVGVFQYEQAHSVILNPASPPAYAADRRVVLMLRGEDGTNRVLGLACHQIRVYVDPI